MICISCHFCCCLFAAIHYWAHTFNFELFIEAWDKQGVDNKTRDFLRDLSEVGQDNGLWVNPVSDPDTVSSAATWLVSYDVTGNMICYVMLLMYFNVCHRIPCTSW